MNLSICATLQKELTFPKIATSGRKLEKVGVTSVTCTSPVTSPSLADRARDRPIAYRAPNLTNSVQGLLAISQGLEVLQFRPCISSLLGLFGIQAIPIQDPDPSLDPDLPMDSF